MFFELIFVSFFVSVFSSYDNVSKNCAINGIAGACYHYSLCKNDEIDYTMIRSDVSGCDNDWEQCCTKKNRIPILPVLSKCGIRNDNDVSVRITGDIEGVAKFGEFPWMVALLKKTSNEVQTNYLCGGSLIHPSVVLTASHCVKNLDVSTIRVRAGEWDIRTTHEPLKHVDHDVKDLVTHEDYFSGPLYNDIALLFLTKPVKIEPHINTICLPEQDQIFNSNRCFVTGWGKKYFGDTRKFQDLLKKTEVPIVLFETCQTKLQKIRQKPNFVLHESFICAGGEAGIDSCKGDGGSPLVCPVAGNPGQYFQAGIVSWGVGCGEADIPAVYANVAKFKNWIDRHLGLRYLDSRSYIP